MSIFLSDVQIAEFDSLVHAAYQAEGFYLRGKMRSRSSVEGATYQFPIINQGQATQKAIQDDVTPMNISYDKRIVTLQDWNAPEYSDIFSQALVNFDEKRELAQTCGRAIGRRNDQICIDALSASATVNVIADGGVGFTFDKLRDVKRMLRKNNATRGQLYLAINASAESDLMAQDKFSNIFYVDNKVIPEGSLDGFRLFGMNIIVFGDMVEGGIPVSAGINTCFAWNMDALGFAEGIALKTYIDWVPVKTSWLVNSVFRAGAIAIDDRGIVKVSSVETTT